MPDLNQSTASPPDPPPGALASEALNNKPPDAAAGMRSSMAAEQKELAGPSAELDKVLNSPRPVRPTTEKVPEPPKRGEDFQKASQGFMTTSILLAGLASVFNRAHITTALNAFGASMKGFHAGQLEAGETAYKEWKQSSDTVIANNNAMLDEYKTVLEDRKLSISEQSSRIAIIASKYKDKFTYEAALMHNQAMYAQLYEQHDAHTKQYAQHAAEMQQAHEDRMAALDAKLTPLNTVEGMKKLAEMPPDQQAKVLEMWRFSQERGDPNKQIFADYVRDFTEANGRPPTAQEEADFRKDNLQSQPRSAPAMATQQFIRDYKLSHGGAQPPAMAISGFMADYQAQIAAVKDFDGAGKGATTIQSFNVAVQHLDTLDELADALKNGNVKKFNQVANRWATETGNVAPTNFETARTIIGNEVVKSIIGVAGTGGDRDKAQAAFDAANSPDILKGSTATIRTLIHGQLVGLEKRYVDTTGKTAEQFRGRLTGSAAKMLGVDEKGGTEGAASKPATALPPTSARVVGKTKWTDPSGQEWTWTAHGWDDGATPQ